MTQAFVLLALCILSYKDCTFASLASEAGDDQRTSLDVPKSSRKFDVPHILQINKSSRALSSHGLTSLSSESYKSEETSSWAPRCPTSSRGIPLLIPNPRNCRSMFSCSNGRPKEYFCPSGQFFNVKYQGCDDQGYCKKVNIEEIPATQPCPTDGSELLYPHDTDCEMYYQCVHGIGLPRPCPAHLHFNSKIQACDYPDKANCKARYFQLTP